MTSSPDPAQQPDSPGDLRGVAVAARLHDAVCPDPILGFDAGLRVTFANPSAADLARLPAAALLGLGVDELAFTSADQRVALALAHHLAPLLALLQERERSVSAAGGAASLPGRA